MVSEEINKGKELFIQRCEHCHTLEENGPHKMGPNLFGIIGKKAGTAPNFKYSERMKHTGILWDESTLDNFLEKPKDFFKHYAEIKDVKIRRAIIKYIQSYGKTN